MASKTKQKPDDILDWTIHDNLDPDDPLPPLDLTPTETSGRRPPSRRQWAWLGAAALLVALVPWAYSQWGWQRTRLEIKDLVVAETGAPPLPLSLARPAEGQAPRLHALTQVSVDTVQADVSHTFSMPDGQAVEFAVPQFYKRNGSAWVLSDAPPDSFPGEAKLYTGARVKISYYAADAALIEGTLAPYLETILGRACVEWGCATDVRAWLDFVNPPRERRPAAPAVASGGDPLVVQLLKAGDLSPSDIPQRAPYRSGYPVTAESVLAWKHVLAMKALAQLARVTIDPESLDQLSRNPYFFALVARTSERLGVEAPHGAGSSDSDAAVKLLESGQFVADGVSLSESVRGALSILDVLLKDQPPDLEFGLLHELKHVSEMEAGAIGWLTQASRANGMTAQEFYSRLRSILGSPGPTSLPPPAEIDFVLSCTPSPQLYRNGRLESVPFLDGLPLLGFYVDWSPDGKRLAINTYLQAITLDLGTGDLFWPQVTAPDHDYAFPSMWVSDSVLAYNQFSASLLQGGPSGLDKLPLSFVDVRDPAQIRDGPPGVIAYPDYYTRLSPDHTTLAILQAQANSGDLGQASTLALMPSKGGPLTQVATDAFLPAWSPDGRWLAFAHLDDVNGGLSLHVWSPGTRLFTRLWNSQDSKLKLDRGSIGVQLAWSPDGAWIALSIAQYRPGTGWLALIRAVDDEVIQVLADSASPGQISFSHDGRWLAAIIQTQQRSDLLIYDVTSGREVRRVEGGRWSNPAWSPRDNRLLVFRDDQPYLLSSPGAEPERLSDLSCMSGAWRP